MDLISYKCLEAYHHYYTKHDGNPKLKNLDAFTYLMQGNYSGENLVSKIIDTDIYWNKMLIGLSVGQGKKYFKVQDYRRNLINTWEKIKETFKSKDEKEISKLMGFLLWGIEEDLVTSYLGLIEAVIKLNKLWKNPIIYDIFCSHFGFIKSQANTQLKTIEELAKNHNINRERVRQIKELSLENLKTDFWFLETDPIKGKIENLFNISSYHYDQIVIQSAKINREEDVNFSPEFYTIMLSMTKNMILVGNINSLKAINRRSFEGNVWNRLYLQTKQERERCNIEKLINVLAIEMYRSNYRFKKEMVIDITPYITKTLSSEEIEYYSSIIAEELEVVVELQPTVAIVKRNTLLTQPEMLEIALVELNGFAYADDILKKLIILFPEKEWTMPMLRTSFKGDKFYSVGKSDLFGLTDIKDLRSQMGNGTLNQIMQIYISGKDSPVHYYELLQHINSLFPRPKNLHAVYAILEQNSRAFFKKFDGGFYGLSEKNYLNVKFPRIVGGHGNSLRQIIRESNGISFDIIYEKFNELYGLEEIQIRYMLYKIMQEYKAILIDGLYYQTSEVSIGNKETVDEKIEEIDVKIDQNELDFEELNQPDVPEEMLGDAVAQIKVRRGQPKFRQKLLKLYKSTCIVTGCDISELLEAAHIIPYSEGQNYNLSNGLLLRADIHTLFDLGMLTIEPESMNLKLNNILLQSEEYSKLENINIGIKLSKLNVNYKLTEEGLRRRWQNFVELE